MQDYFKNKAKATIMRLFRVFFSVSSVYLRQITGAGQTGRGRAPAEYRLLFKKSCELGALMPVLWP